MEGTLFRYGPAAANVAFLSGRHPRHVVLVGGLTDGLLFAPFVRPLAARLEERRWSLVQTLLSSSHTGYGCASLDQDAQELHRLACHLKAEYGSQGMVIVGHSTGCQDAVRYAQRYRSAPSGGGGNQAPSVQQQQAGAAAGGPGEGAAAAPAAAEAAEAAAAAEAAPLLGIVLQAPVSDVECFGMQPSTAERIQRAAAMVKAGQGEDVAFRATDIDGAPMTARRWLSLACPGGDDDMFSCGLSDAQLAAIYGPLHGLPTLLLLSGADQYVPPEVDYPAMGHRLAQAIGASARLHIVGGALHALDGKEGEGAAAIAQFVAAVAP